MIIPAIIAFILVLAAAYYAIGQLVQQTRFKFSRDDYSFWGEKSDYRKYKLLYVTSAKGKRFPVSAPDTWYYRFFKVKYKEKFPLSATFLVMFTDGYHLTQHVSFVLYACAPAAALRNLWLWIVFYACIGLGNWTARIIFSR